MWWCERAEAEGVAEDGGREREREREGSIIHTPCPVYM